MNEKKEEADNPHWGEKDRRDFPVMGIILSQLKKGKRGAQLTSRGKRYIEREDVKGYLCDGHFLPWWMAFLLKI